MSALLKTLPVRFARGEIERFLGVGEGHDSFCTYYFTLGRGRPRRPGTYSELYFTHRGVILGHFDLSEIVQNKGQLPLLTTLDGAPSEWQIKPDRWVAICAPPFHPLDAQIFHGGFQGWRYFDLAAYSRSLDSKVRL